MSFPDKYPFSFSVRLDCHLANGSDPFVDIQLSKMLMECTILTSVCSWRPQLAANALSEVSETAQSNTATSNTSTYS